MPAGVDWSRFSIYNVFVFCFVFCSLAHVQAGDAEKKRIAKEQSVRKLYLALVAGINVRFVRFEILLDESGIEN